MLEYLLIIIVLFFIGVLFYKQANEEFQILQLDADRLSELPTLYADRSPIVVSDFPTPNLGTQALQKRFDATAKESGLSVWFEHHLYKDLLSPYTRWIYSFNTSLWPLRRGLFKTTAFQTIIMPTEGTASVKLMLLKMVPYLPNGWQGRSFSSLSLYDTPLLNQIQFIEIRVRKGNLLFLPAHMIVDIDSTDNIFIAEINHPISLIAS